MQTATNWREAKKELPKVEGPVLVSIYMEGRNPIVAEAYFSNGAFYEDLNWSCLRVVPGVYAWAPMPPAPYYEPAEPAQA